MAKSERRACPACGTWRCSDCGWSRSGASRFTKGGQTCGKCESKSGVMLPVFHTSRMKARDHESEVDYWNRTFGPPAHPLSGFDYELGYWEDHVIPLEPEGSSKDQ